MQICKTLQIDSAEQCEEAISIYKYTSRRFVCPSFLYSPSKTSHLTWSCQIGMTPSMLWILLWCAPNAHLSCGIINGNFKRRLGHVTLFLLLSHISSVVTLTQPSTAPPYWSLHCLVLRRALRLTFGWHCSGVGTLSNVDRGLGISCRRTRTTECLLGRIL